MNEALGSFCAALLTPLTLLALAAIATAVVLVAQWALGCPGDHHRSS